MTNQNGAGLHDLHQTTYHLWTRPATVEQQRGLIRLRGMYDSLNQIDAELVTFKDDEEQQAWLRGQRKAVEQKIHEEEESLKEQKLVEMLQIRITMRSATGRTEAIYRGLMSEAAQAFKQETGKSWDPDEWEKDEEIELEGLSDAYTAWARMMAQAAKVETRLVNVLEYEPEEYEDEAGPWIEWEDALDEWRDPATALDLLPESLINSASTQAMMLSRQILDGRFLPTAARRKEQAGSAATSTPSTPRSPASSKPAKGKTTKKKERKTGDT